MDKMDKYTEFCESMTVAMNLHAMMHGDCLVTIEQVMGYEQAQIAFTACVCTAQIAA